LRKKLTFNQDIAEKKTSIVLDICRSRSIGFFTQNTVFCKYLPLRIVKDRACNGKQNRLQETERNKSGFHCCETTSFVLFPFSLFLSRHYSVWRSIDTCWNFHGLH